MIPSSFAASAWIAWLAVVVAVTWFAVALPWLPRLTLCATTAAAGLHGLRDFVLLKGPRAVRAIEWTDAGDLSVCLGATLVRYPATLATGSFRAGPRFWVLWFATPVGRRSVVVEEPPRDVRAFRRISRCLNGQLRRRSGRYRQPAVTIQPKV